LRFVRRSPVRVILVAWLVCWAAFAPIFGFRSTTELRVYIAAAGRLAAGTEIYRPHDAVSIFAYPPAFALPFVPLAALSETAQRVLWVGANALMTVLAVALLQSIVRPRSSGGSWPCSARATSSRPWRTRATTS
jgi:low affinity Fe/Cu permease